MKGQYSFDQAEVDASLQLDVKNIELFAFLVSGIIDEMSGSLKGEATIKGPIQKPEFNGQLRFMDVGFTTSNPTLKFKIKDDIITLDKSALLFNNFTMYDQENQTTHCAWQYFLKRLSILFI